ncbi:nitric oxide reductase activation protein NorD [Nocardia sp. NPDC058499]|uniref:nitric oxide reductase activation protein NorD n=1 Tax=Nocardia sp. NPDC058499 TaxID=3346530 RepID=UPI00365FEA65
MIAEQSAEPESGGLATLASAIAGRTVRIAYVPAGEPTWTDGNCIYLDPSRTPTYQRQSLALHASLISGGSLAPAILRTLGRKASLAARYLTVEGHRALLANADTLPHYARTMIDREIAALADSADAALMIARSRMPLPDAPAYFGVVRARTVLLTHAAEPQASAAGAYRPRSDRQGESELSDDDEATDDDLPDVFTNPIGGGGAIGRLFRAMLDAVRKPGGNGPPGADSAGYRGRPGTRGAGAVTSGSAVGADSPGLSDNSPGACLYPEWDAHRSRYRPHWCTVLETPPDADPQPWLPHPDRHGLQRPLARLGSAPGTARRRPQGDDLDLDAVVEARTRILSGSAPDEAVYLDTLRHRRDLSVLVLLDISGSVAQAGGNGVPIHDQQRTAAASLVSALHGLGDRVALYAFRSQGRSAVHILPVKRFDELLATPVLQRLHSLRPGAYSRLGAAIRHGTAVLRADGGTARRLLLVLSDGLAYDHGYDRAYGAADAHRALAETRRDGIGCLCLTIGADTGDADLARVFGSAAYVTVPGPEHLPAIVGPLFRSALHMPGTRIGRPARHRDRPAPTAA